MSAAWRVIPPGGRDPWDTLNKTVKIAGPEGVTLWVDYDDVPCPHDEVRSIIENALSTLNGQVEQPGIPGIVKELHDLGTALGDTQGDLESLGSAIERGLDSAGRDIAEAIDRGLDKIARRDA